MAAAGISKRLKGSSLKIDKKISSPVVTEVSIKSKCKGDVGFKSVNITWASSEQINSSNVTTYRVKYCTSGSPCESTTTGPYKLGCILNATSLQKELQCRIVAKSLFPFQFYYTVEIQTLFGVFISNIKHCRLLSNTQCTRPQNLTILTTGKRALSLSWKPPPFMGEFTSLLCYKIWYAAAQADTNESVIVSYEDQSQLSWMISDLYPYTDYKFFIQCGFADCYKGWGLLDGPVTGRTAEEAPTKAPEFKNWSISNISKDKRDVTVLWKLPPSNTWNGIPRRFSIDFWQEFLEDNGSSLALPNSSKNLQIDDGSATEATLFGLNRFADYKTQISMCTNKGCGPRSVPLPFSGERKTKHQSMIDDANDDSKFIWIVIGVVAGLSVLFLILVVIAIRRHRQNQERRRHQPPLGQRIQLEDPVYGNLEDSSSGTRRHTYDEIILHEPDEDFDDAENQDNGPLFGNQGITSSSRRYSNNEVQLHEHDEDLHNARIMAI